MFDSQVSSAMQWHCGLRLFFKNIYSTIHALLYLTVWSVVLRPLLSFFLTNGPQTTLFEVDCRNDLFSLPFGKTGSYILQLDWLRTAEWTYAVIFAAAVQFQNQDNFWISHQNLRGRFYLFEKLKNELFDQKYCFWQS